MGPINEGYMTAAGKGHAIRRTSDAARYGAEWDRLCGQKCEQNHLRDCAGEANITHMEGAQGADQNQGKQT
jgi:hypothetical protein